MYKLTNNTDTPRSFTTPLGVFAAAPDGGSCEVPDDAAKLLKADPAFQFHLDEGNLDFDKVGKSAKTAPAAEPEAEPEGQDEQAGDPA